MRQRLFTVEEANAMLPVVRELVAEIQAKKQELDGLSGELEALLERASGNGHDSAARAVPLRAATAKAASELESLLAKLQATGCEPKGIEDGLVDFPSEREGRVVYLCWKMGEEDIRYWHELDTGFPGRQPL
jgi:hypothetical protein